MQNDKSNELRQQLIDYIRINAPWHENTDLEQYSATALAIFKEIIEEKIQAKKMHNPILLTK